MSTFEVLLAIVGATLVAGIGSVWIAAALLRIGPGRIDDGGAQSAQQLLSLAAGALLATAFMHLLPEAFESGASPASLFAVLLFGLVCFFLLDKAELWHHGHEHHHHQHDQHDHRQHAGDAAAAHLHDAAAHGHGHAHPQAHAHTPSHVSESAMANIDAAASGAFPQPQPQPQPQPHPQPQPQPQPQPAAPPRAGAWAVLTGDSVHCFGDGILIASAFVADVRLGLVAAVAVLAHEVPHHIGDLVVLRSTSNDSRAALIKVSLAGTMTAFGGVIGWWLVEQLRGWLPYFLVIASSSFMYVALADLIPQLQRRLGARETTIQVAWLAAGIAIVTLASHLSH